MKIRPRVLLMAYQCAPGQGSVSQIGWEWYSRLSQRAQVTLVTHIRNRTALQGESVPAPDAEVVFIDTEAFARPLYRLSSTLFPRSQHTVYLISSLDFYVFDRKATAALKRMQRQGRAWDIAHMVTPVSPSASPTLHRLGIPSILGPLNGGLETPKTFPELMRRDSAWLYPIRNVGRLFEVLNRGIRSASALLVATDATEQAIEPRYKAKCIRMLENGVDLSLFPAKSWPSVPSMSNPMRIVPFKGVPLLLEALRALNHRAHLTIVGDGPERQTLEHLAEDFGLSDIVTFLGAQPLKIVSDVMQRSHVFCLPSVRESGGAVLLEAMACARPVVAIKHGGPAEIVDDLVGYAIEPLGRKYVVSELTKILQDVISNPEIWRRKGLEGCRRAQGAFGWDRKIDSILDIYVQALEAKAGNEPVPPPPALSHALLNCSNDRGTR
jgi:alpha-maltose-1-phosphate synthase